MNVRELAAQLTELAEKGHGDSEVRLRASYGDRITVRTGVSGIAHELRVGDKGPNDLAETILLWGRAGD